MITHSKVTGLTGFLLRALRGAALCAGLLVGAGRLPAQAEDLKESGLFKDPTASRAAFVAGQEKLRKKDYAGALIEYEKAVRFSPNDAFIHVTKGIKLLEVGDTPSAVLELQDASRRYPQLFLIYAGSGATRRYIGDYYAALLDLTVAIGLHPGYAPLYGLRGECRAGLEDYEAALADYDLAIACDGRNAYAYYQRGRTKFALGRSAEAVEDLTQAIKFNPGVPAGYFSRSLVYSVLGEKDKALADQAKVIELAPKNPVGYMQHAWLQALQGNYANALQDYASAEKIDPSLPSLARNRATLYEIINDPAKAKECYLSALQNPKRNKAVEGEVYLHLQYDLFQLRVTHAKLELGPYFDDIADWTDNWGKRVVLYLKGRITAESLLKSAEQEKRFFQHRRQVCEAQYYIGYAEMLAGHDEAARQRFTACIAMQHSENYEHLLALGHLQRLVHPHPEDPPP